MSFVRCNSCGSTFDAADLAKILDQPSDSASGSFKLLGLISPPFTCVHCGSSDLSPAEQPGSFMPDSARPAASNESRCHSSAPPPVTREASGKRRRELDPTAVMLAIVGMVVLVVFTGIIQTFGTGGHPSIGRAVIATRNYVPSAGDTFRAGNLEWQHTPPGGVMDWYSAKIYCDTLSLAGGGWRLPSRDELDALYASKPRGNAAKPGMDLGSYWSSSASSAMGVQRNAWLVNFHYGNTEVENVDSKNPVRCVR